MNEPCRVCGRVFSVVDSEPHECDPTMVILAKPALPPAMDLCAYCGNQWSDQHACFGLAQAMRDTVSIRDQLAAVKIERDEARAALRALLDADARCDIEGCGHVAISYSDTKHLMFCDTHRQLSDDAVLFEDADAIRTAVAVVGDGNDG